MSEKECRFVQLSNEYELKQILNTETKTIMKQCLYLVAVPYFPLPHLETWLLYKWIGKEVEWSSSYPPIDDGTAELWTPTHSAA